MTEYITEHYFDSESMAIRQAQREEIVRCRDCANYYEAEEYHPNGNYDRRCCKYFGTYDDEVSPDGFCAWAVKQKEGRRMNGAICFICNELYYSDNETRIHVERIEREEDKAKTLRWDGVLCDKCLGRLFGKEGGE